MKNSIFLEMFVSEFVEIVQDFNIPTSFQIVDDKTQEVRVPMTVNGFVMDTDDAFVYLSPDGENVTQAIPMNSIKHVGIVELKGPHDDLMDEVETPGDPHGFN